MTFLKSSSLLSTPFGLLLSLFNADASSANSSRFPPLASSSSSSSSVGGDFSQGNFFSQCGKFDIFSKNHLQSGPPCEQMRQAAPPPPPPQSPLLVAFSGILRERHFGFPSSAICEHLCSPPLHAITTDVCLDYTGFPASSSSTSD